MKLKKFDDINGYDYDLVTNDLHKDVQVNKEIIVVKKTKKYWLISSIITFLIFSLVLIIYLKYNGFLAENNIYDEYYRIENVSKVTRGDYNILDAFVEFSHKNYKESSKLYKNIMLKDNTNVEAYFYYSICNMELENFEESIKYFNYIIDKDDMYYTPHAQWYLSLCYLKENQEDKAVDILIKIAASEDNIHKKEAKEILIKLAEK